MSNGIGTYSFLPWLRQGLANQLQATGGPGTTRATLQVALRLEGEAADGSTLQQTIQRTVQLYGPGDVVGIDRRAIVKTEPQPWITNFEPNYLPYIEFYDEDFPWRYTPEVPANHRLRPWIMLVVLKENEFEEGPARQDRPLPFIAVSGADALFPPHEQLWAWAHVHVNADLASAAGEIVSTDMNAVLPRLQALLDKDPDGAYSRIICPRRLEANALYHAFLLPVFESGRLAGLGLDPDTAPSAGHAAWQPDPAKEEPDHYPYYYRWAFKSGAMGDFEYLVRLLEPKPVDSRVGRREMDVQDPGSNLSGITDPELEGVLRLGGALRVPFDTLGEEEQAEFLKYEQWDQSDYPHPFQEDLAAFINLADDYSRKATADAHTESAFDTTMPDPENPGARIDDPDPLITPPLYGRWHALTSRLLVEPDGSSVTPNDNWVHELNLDPRHRVTAGFGTEVVQQNQETYMNAAWEQIGDVLAANRRIRLAQLSRMTSERWYARDLVPLLNGSARVEKALLLTMPVQRRLMAGGVTAFHRVRSSPVPLAATSTTTRRLLRPRGRLARALPFDAERTPGNLLTRLNDREVTAAPPRAELEGAPTLGDLSEVLEPADVPSWAQQLLRRYPRLPQLLLRLIILSLILLPLCLPFGFLSPLLLLLAVALSGLRWQLRRWQEAMAPAESLREQNQTPQAVDRMPPSPDFRLVEPGDPFIPGLGTHDSPEATRYKQALREAYALLDATRRTGVSDPPRPLDLPQFAQTVVGALDPDVTIRRLTYHDVLLPGHIKEQIGERFVEVMAYPVIDTPMYRPLVDKSVDYFLPNIHYIEQNTISLLETNQPFIEAYMVGLNHEFARELLWREYPTDQRGSTFRQFWDASGYLHGAPLNREALREKLRDIPPLHRWSKFSSLGDHDHRETEGESEEEVVLVIRGELLKKYPTAVIYAHRARWQRNEDGTINNRVERRLEDPGAADLPNPPRDRVKTPLYEAKVDPDIYFFGFDLTVKEAQGGTGENETDDPGWFFVIKERPGEPRFGLDIGAADEIFVWNDMGWENVTPTTQPGDYLQITPATPTIQVQQPLPPDQSEQAEQAEDDRAVRWHRDMDAAELAYILYQVPVLVAVHAAEMLPREE